MIDWNKVIGPCMAVFGEPVTYFAKSGVVQIIAVFDEAHFEMTPFGTGEVDSRFDTTLGSPGPITTEVPVLGVQLSQFPPVGQPAQGDTAIIRNATYVVKQVRLDSHGGAKLMLNLVG